MLDEPQVKRGMQMAQHLARAFQNNLQLLWNEATGIWESKADLSVL
jgi:hypothetical protein